MTIDSLTTVDNIIGEAYEGEGGVGVDPTTLLWGGINGVVQVEAVIVCILVLNPQPHRTLDKTRASNIRIPEFTLLYALQNKSHSTIKKKCPKRGLCAATKCGYKGGNT